MPVNQHKGFSFWKKSTAQEPITASDEDSDPEMTDIALMREILYQSRSLLFTSTSYKSVDLRLTESTVCTLHLSQSKYQMHVYITLISNHVWTTSVFIAKICFECFTLRDFSCQAPDMLCESCALNISPNYRLLDRHPTISVCKWSN